MLTLIFGFISIVLLPVIIIAISMYRLNNAPLELHLREDDLRFTLSSDAK